MDELLFLVRFAAGLAVLMVLGFVAWRERHRFSPRFGGKESAAQCDHLGYADDPFTRDARPNEAHRCYANLGRERIDLTHQQRFCLASTHNRCPFLTVRPAVEGAGVLSQARAWWRSVSPAHPAQAGLQLGHTVAELGLPLLRRLPAVLKPWAESMRDRLVNAMKRRVEVRSEALAARLATAQDRLMQDASVAQQSEMVEPAPPRVQVVVPAAPQGPGLLPRVAAQENDLVERGIAAVEAGDEAVGYRLFRRATEVDRRAVRAWFWRAKTAETLDEVIACLRAAHELDPSNTQIVANLQGAEQRRDATRASSGSVRELKQERPKPPRPARPSLVARSLRWCVELLRTGAAMAAFVVAAAWLLSALPSELRQQLLVSAGLTTLPVPDASLIASLVQFTLPDGFAVGSTLPFGLGFLALFVGMGLLSGDAWTRLWAPILGAASAYLWMGASGTLPSPMLLPVCAVVVMGGMLSFRR